ncbi:MAG: DUF4230 domain-containing protein [Paenisporosarcina sp.]
MDTNEDILKAKDERIARLEKMIIDLTEAKQQIAVTIADAYNSRTFSKSKSKFKFSTIVSSLKAFFIIFLLLVIIGGGIWLYQMNKSKQSSETFIKNVQELSKLATAELYTETVLQSEDNKIFGKNIPLNIFGTKREVIFVVPASVIAGVDLKEVTSEDMVINKETNEITITLPHAELIQKPSLDVAKIRYIVDGSIFNGELDQDEVIDFVANAQKQISKEVASNGLLTTAEDNAEKVLTEFFKNMDYTAHITFEE